MDDRCLVCGGQYEPSKLPGLLSCATCRFTTANMRLSQEELEGLYTARYFHGEEYRDYLADRALIERQFRNRLEKLLKWVPNPGDRHLLEIGSAYGFFLQVARERFKAVQGLELSRDAAAYAEQSLGLPVSVCDFLEYDVTGPIDVLCLWDTIEHLQEPHRYLEKAAAHMPRGGVVALTTGDLGSLIARLRGARWRQIHPPTHLHYFSKRTLARLLSNYGFEVAFCGYEGMRRSLETIAYIILNIKHAQPKLYSSLKRLGLLNGSLYMNVYDILFVVAVKK